MAPVISANPVALPAGDPAARAHAGTSSCFHCGEALPAQHDWPVTIHGIERATCCPGCQAVAQTIADTGLDGYYNERTAFPAASAAAPDAAMPPELLLFDEPEVLRQFATVAEPGSESESESMEATFTIDGIRCAACIWLIEGRLERTPGVERCTMNIGTGRLHVRWNRTRCKPSALLQAVRAVGYTAYPFDAARQEGQLQRAAKTLFRQLFVAGLSMMQVMMYAVPAYVAGEGAIEPDMEALLRWASLVLTLPAVVYSALPFFRGAWDGLRHRALVMDVPVALGIAAAFAGSTVATWRGEGEVYFDSVTMFIFLLLCSRYLELSARRKAASALQALSHALPASAVRLPRYPDSRATETIAAARLAAGDVILVRPGEAVPADCIVLDGATAIDLSLLTGESRPQARNVGESVPGGAVNASQAMLLRVVRPVVGSTLAAMVRLIERAGQSRPRIALWADRVAAWFVAALLLLAAGVFLFWLSADPQRAWPIAIAVLVVSCPCALSLATPTALAAATDLLVRRGVLIVHSHVLETLHRATHIVFDKTGTLTAGKPRLRKLQAFAGDDDTWLLGVAAALEASSAHPLGAALIEAARLRGATPDLHAVSDIVQTPGQGLEGRVDGVRYRLGNASFVAQLCGERGPGLATAAASGEDASDRARDANEDALADATPIFMGASGRWLARFDLADAVREDARAVVAHFRAAGKTVMLLSGDEPAVTLRVAASIGIDQAYGACLPEHKLRFVQELQQAGAVVAMVGDGINDAAVLRGADVSFAMGSGAVLAQTHADAVLLSGRLDPIREASVMASRTLAVIRQNLAWATLYNMVAIPAAALGWVNPWMSGIGMSFSSAVVVVNALRLRRMAKAVTTDPACERDLPSAIDTPSSLQTISTPLTPQTTQTPLALSTPSKPSTPLSPSESASVSSEAQTSRSSRHFPDTAIKE